MIGALAPLALVGCGSVQEPVRAFYRQMDAPLMNAAVADAYQKELPCYLGLASEQVHVQLTEAAFDLIICDVRAESERQRISSAVAGMNAENPQLLPLHLRFQ